MVYPRRLTIHEVGIAQNIITIVEEAAQKNGMKKVKKITLQVGVFSGVVAELLRFAFEAITRNTILEGAEIEIETPALLLYCAECENEYLGEIDDLRCPVCQGEDFEIVQGRELLVKSITGEES